MQGHRRVVTGVLAALLCLGGASCGRETGGGRSGGGAAGQGGARSDPASGGGSSGKSSAAGKTPGGGSASGGHGASSDWGCADDGKTCLCYEPGGQGYDAPSCGHYDCCFYAEYPQGNECECVTLGSCEKTNPDAKRVSSCPP